MPHFWFLEDICELVFWFPTILRCFDAAPARVLLHNMLRLQGYPSVLVLPVAFVLLLTAKLIYTVVYNLFFHPLAKIPGPRIAAATYLYQTYYSIVGGSRYYVRIKELHEIYGKSSSFPSLAI